MNALIVSLRVKTAGLRDSLYVLLTFLVDTRTGSRFLDPVFLERSRPVSTYAMRDATAGSRRCPFWGIKTVMT